MKNFFKLLLKTVDIFSVRPHLYINKKKVLTTVFGGFCSLLVFILAIIIMYE